MSTYYIRTQREDAYVGNADDPELFDTQAEARRRADELSESTPSSYGRLIVSKWAGSHHAYRAERHRAWAIADALEVQA